ncbi:MAG: N-acetylmuramoyl-L-alanine amidase, partial [Candidatus Omnitrophica bacterium]|nr:N-acetylmuramoyl-L-alanine amidase [Candidatus Omnitrophota bacterium]
MSNIYKKGLLLLLLSAFAFQLTGCAHQARARRRRGDFPGEHKIRAIVVDPGHGGKDPGAVGVGRLKEKDVVLDISKRLKKRLERAG